MSAKMRAKLSNLEKVLRPATLIERIRGIVIGGDLSSLDLDEKDIAKALQRQKTAVVSLGEQLAQRPEDLTKLLPELVSGQGQFWDFGRGLEFGSKEPKKLWSALVSAWEATHPTNRNTLVLRGFLNGLAERDQSLLNELLDAALEDEILGAEFPTLQTSVLIDEKGVARLHLSLTLNLTSGKNYYVLMGGRATDPIPGKDLRALLAGIAAKQDGTNVAMEILYMRLFSDRDLKKPPSPDLLVAGQEILQKVEFKRDGADSQDHRLASIVSACLGEENAAVAFKAVCDKFKKAFSDRKIFIFQFEDFLRSLFKVRPIDALENFLGGDAANQKLGISILSERFRDRNVLKFVSGDHIIQWCNRSPADRYLTIADVIPLFPRDDQTGLQWNPIVLALIEQALDPLAFMKKIIDRLRPTSWSGSLAAIMETRASLLSQLEVYRNPAIAALARQEAIRFKEEIASVRQWETELNKSTDERFE